MYERAKDYYDDAWVTYSSQVSDLLDCFDGKTFTEFSRSIAELDSILEGLEPYTTTSHIKFCKIDFLEQMIKKVRESN